jgi:hypothetical protein
MTGTQLRAAESRTSKDCLPPFDVELAMRLAIQPPSECEKPADPIQAWEPDVQELPQYTAVNAAWTGKLPAATELVGFWEELDCFNWVSKEAPKPTESPIKRLVAQCPGRFIGELDQYLVESPMMSKG